MNQASSLNISPEGSPLLSCCCGGGGTWDPAAGWKTAADGWLMFQKPLCLPQGRVGLWKYRVLLSTAPGLVLPMGRAGALGRTSRRLGRTSRASEQESWG